MVDLDESDLSAYRSRFGGLWTDLNHAPRLIRERLEAGELTESQAQQLSFWIDHGYLVIENAVPEALVDQVSADLECAWRGELSSVWVEHWANDRQWTVPIQEELREEPHKLLDLHASSEVARDAIFSAPIAEFLTLIFERPPLAFQSLSFERGTAQPIHQDTAYVVLDSPMEFAASWIALEDVRPGSGQLEYYDGSHMLPEHLFDGVQKNMPAGSLEHEAYLISLVQRARAQGLERKSLFIKKGDALIWSADLAHGGCTDIEPGSTRRSLVTHYCPREIEPDYFRHGPHSDRLQHRPGAFYCHCIRA